MHQSQLPGTLQALKEALAMYQEARQIYQVRRRTPAGLKELIQRLRASGVQEDPDSSDGGSDDMWSHLFRNA